MSITLQGVRPGPGLFQQRRDHSVVDKGPQYDESGPMSTILFGVKIDPDDLIDAQVIAEMLGLSHRRAVSTYRGRYDDFPDPVVDMGTGRCLLWLRPEVEAWAAARSGS